MIAVEDASGYQGHADREFAPTSIDELAAVVREAASQRIPITVAGGRTGVTGGCCPQGGWLVGMQRLNALRIEQGIAFAQAGVSLQTLHAEAVATGQLYPPDPTEWTATAGGSIATNASGSRSFLYGATRRWVRALTVVMAGGTVRKFRRGDKIEFEVPTIRLPHTRKNTAGYLLQPSMDWIDLITGSEGTLAIVAEAELKLIPTPRDLLTGVIFFADDETALAAVDAWRTVPGVRMLEYVDSGSLRLLQQPGGSALLIEQELGLKADVHEWLDRLEEQHALLEDSWIASNNAERERFRKFRHALPEKVNETVRRNGFLKLGSDFAVPVESNLTMLRCYREHLEREFAGRYVIFGHIGDAHVHVNILPTTQAEFDRGRELMIEFARKAVSLGGTVSAEHGLGKRKRDLLQLQYPAKELEAMRAVKRRLDPDGLLGRGNLFS
ncbi:MAG: FAD-binding oxidoreductase [Bryobacterales bacterium]|nr:FAD-binding oxidoreductase [Bryobacterales bacterium]